MRKGGVKGWEPRSWAELRCGRDVESASRRSVAGCSGAIEWCSGGGLSCEVELSRNRAGQAAQKLAVTA